ncbi:hypothetical protein NKG05_13020 [Oerskovia sp. M15]
MVLTTLTLGLCALGLAFPALVGVLAAAAVWVRASAVWRRSSRRRRSGRAARRPTSWARS